MNKLNVLDTKIIEISQKIDSTVKEITMLVHKIGVPNANGLDFLKEYTEQYMNSLLDKPVVCKYNEQKDDLGTHEQVIDPKTNKIIELKTIAIGTITDVWIDKINDEDEIEALYAKATIWSYKYPKIMACIERLFSEGVSTSSVEVEIHQYGDNPTQEYRYGTNFTYLANCLLGSTVEPADSDAGTIDITNKEIASAVKEDLKELNSKNEEKEEKNMDDVTQIQFNKGHEISYHGKIETNALKFSDVSNQIYNLLNPLNPKTNERKYNYYILDMYVDHVIVEEWDDYNVLWRIGYEINGDTVILQHQENWIKGYKGFIPESIDIDQLIADMQSANQQVTELNNKLNEFESKKEELNSMEKTVERLTAELAEKESTIIELNGKITVLEGKVTELSETIVSQEEAKKKMESQITELNSKIEELTPFKEQVEKAEKEAKITELNNKYSALLSEETFKSERVQNAIANLDTMELNAVVVEEVAKVKANAIETASKKDEDVVVKAKKSEDLIPQDIISKYGLSI